MGAHLGKRLEFCTDPLQHPLGRILFIAARVTNQPITVEVEDRGS